MRRRQAFTLVEMLVSMTLTIFILIIITQAFVTGLETFRQLKAIGDMESSLRNVATMLRNDLSADHFEGKRRLSDPNFWTVGPPQQGFFRLLQVPINNVDATVIGGKLVGTVEGLDADGIPSRRRVGHVLHFTKKTVGNRPENFLAASIGDKGSPLLLQTFGQADSRYELANPQLAGFNQTFNSQWAEIAYFLVPTGPPAIAAGPTANGTSLFALYRRQRLAVTDNAAVNWSTMVAAPGNAKAQLAAYSQISCEVHPPNNNVKPPLPQRLYFNNPTDLTIPERRFAPFGLSSLGAFTPLPPIPPGYVAVTDANGKPTGADLLLTSVISFDVQIINLAGGLMDVPPMFVPPPPAAPPPLATVLNNPLVNAGMFDTWSTVRDDQFDYSNPANMPIWVVGGTPVRPVINGLKITIRVWDAKTEQSRQVTIIQDM